MILGFDLEHKKRKSNIYGRSFSIRSIDDLPEILSTNFTKYCN